MRADIEAAQRKREQPLGRGCAARLRPLEPGRVAGQPLRRRPAARARSRAPTWPSTTPQARAPSLAAGPHHLRRRLRAAAVRQRHRHRYDSRGTRCRGHPARRDTRSDPDRVRHRGRRHLRRRDAARGAVAQWPAGRSRRDAQRGDQRVPVLGRRRATSRTWRRSFALRLDTPMREAVVAVLKQERKRVSSPGASAVRIRSTSGSGCPGARIRSGARRARPGLRGPAHLADTAATGVDALLLSRGDFDQPRLVQSRVLPPVAVALVDVVEGQDDPAASARRRRAPRTPSGSPSVVLACRGVTGTPLMRRRTSPLPFRRTT